MVAIFLSSISPLLLSQTLKHTKAKTNHVLEGFNLFSLLFFFQYADKVFDEENSSVRESSNDEKEGSNQKWGEKCSIHTLRGRELPPQLLHSY